MADTKEHVSQSSRIWNVVEKVAISLVFLIGSVIISHEIRIARLEETRFTAVDGETLRKEITAAMPPAWLREQIKDMQTVLRSIEERLRALENHRPTVR